MRSCLRTLLQPLLCAAFAAGLCAQENYVLPEDKTPVVVDPRERNPFARRGPAPETTFVEEDVESEESKLRALLEKMKVTGFTEFENKTSVLLGGLRIEPGTILPPLLENQSEQLRVVSITNNQIELLFIDPPERQLNRTIRLRYDPQPRVRYILSTQMPEAAPDTSFQGLYPSPQASTDEQNRP